MLVVTRRGLGQARMRARLAPAGLGPGSWGRRLGKVNGSQRALHPRGGATGIYALFIVHLLCWVRPAGVGRRGLPSLVLRGPEG